MGWWGLAGAVLTVIFWIAIIWLIVWGVKRFSGGRPGGGRERTPLDIAKERYAKGEITREQFEQLKKDLS
ncbi:MAG: SHOCT domain-containing protein [Chloroflexi bacterium]|nr:SHOCT domain-containing protein [Chloroflexota bacterium]